MLHIVSFGFCVYLFLLREIGLIIPLVLWVFAFTWAIVRDVKDVTLLTKYNKLKYGYRK